VDHNLNSSTPGKLGGSASAIAYFGVSCNTKTRESLSPMPRAASIPRVGLASHLTATPTSLLCHTRSRNVQLGSTLHPALLHPHESRQ
jgi:hypothetical protein